MFKILQCNALHHRIIPYLDLLILFLALIFKRIQFFKFESYNLPLIFLNMVIAYRFILNCQILVKSLFLLIGIDNTIRPILFDLPLFINQKISCN